MAKPRVCLVNMPFGAPEAPSLGLTQLRTVLDERFGDALDLEVHYLNLEFVAFLGGLENYRRFFTGPGRLAGLGDWFFRQSAFPEAEDNTEAYLARYFFEDDVETSELRRFLLDRRAALDEFLDRLLDTHGLSEAEVVGFTALFFQTVASFALARKIKERRAAAVTVIGGAACETVMGREYARQVPQIDYVFSGPALVSFPRFLEGRILSGDVASCDRIDGVFTKGNLEMCKAAPGCGDGESDTIGLLGAELDIDAGVSLDYGPFLDRFERAFPGGGLRPMLLFETSRGCSWGEKVACTFCGLNGMSMPYRSMAPERALSYLRHLFTYVPRCTFFLGVDTLVPDGYFAEVFPHLGTPANAALMYEVRTGLSEDELRMLCEAGVHVIQPGIEALSTATLRLMHKGATAFRNVRFLKTAARFPLRLEWNLLIGSPREEETTYEKYLRDLPSLFHLHPPTGAFPISFDRYSVYFLQPGEFGLDLEPQEFCRFTFPFGAKAVANVSYHFIDRQQDHVAADHWLDRLNDLVARWRARWENSDGLEEARLCFLGDEGAPRVYDSRLGQLLEIPLSVAAREILEALEVPRTRNNLAEHFGRHPELAVTPCDLERELAFFRKQHLLFEENGRFLSLVVDDGG